MKLNEKRLLVTLSVGLVLTFGFFLITEAITKYTGFSVAPADENDFEVCLKEQDITLYINSVDISKTLNEIELKNDLKKFKIFNCEKNKQVCSNKEINSFPTWIINNEIIPRDINLNELAGYAGCEVIK